MRNQCYRTLSDKCAVVISRGADNNRKFVQLWSEKEPGLAKVVRPKDRDRASKLGLSVVVISWEAHFGARSRKGKAAGKEGLKTPTKQPIEDDEEDEDEEVNPNPKTSNPKP